MTLLKKLFTVSDRRNISPARKEFPKRRKAFLADSFLKDNAYSTTEKMNPAPRTILNILQLRQIQFKNLALVKPTKLTL